MASELLIRIGVFAGAIREFPVSYGVELIAGVIVFRTLETLVSFFL